MTGLLKLIEDSKWKYPFLYGDDQYTLWRILDHLYFTLGNGYEWNDSGEMEYLFDGEDKAMTQERHNSELRQWYEYRVMRRTLDKLIGIDDDAPPHRFYPLFSGSLINETPQNATDEYVIAGWLLLDYAINAPDELFLDSERDGVGVGYSATRERAKVTELREWYKEKFGDRLAHLSWKTVYE